MADDTALQNTDNKEVCFLSVDACGHAKFVIVKGQNISLSNGIGGRKFSTETLPIDGHKLSKKEMNKNG